MIGQPNERVKNKNISDILKMRPGQREQIIMHYTLPKSISLNENKWIVTYSPTIIAHLLAIFDFDSIVLRLDPSSRTSLFDHLHFHNYKFVENDPGRDNPDEVFKRKRTYTINDDKLIILFGSRYGRFEPRTKIQFDGSNKEIRALFEDFEARYNVYSALSLSELELRWDFYPTKRSYLYPVKDYLASVTYQKNRRSTGKSFGKDIILDDRKPEPEPNPNLTHYSTQRQTPSEEHPHIVRVRHKTYLHPIEKPDRVRSELTLQREFLQNNLLYKVSDLKDFDIDMSRLISFKQLNHTKVLGKMSSLSSEQLYLTNWYRHHILEVPLSQQIDNLKSEGIDYSRCLIPVNFEEDSN
ncbi:MAG: hypothetical protein ACLQVJ_12345 [Syntrophobacteraceae bacterium]